MSASQHCVKRHGFTLIEVVVLISIVAVLAGLLFPAVQQARESARRTTCTSRLRQQGLGLLAFESIFKTLPAGAEAETLHAWSSRILPYMEQANLYQHMNFRIPWDAGVNADCGRRRLEIFSCPSSWKNYAGSTDYSGISGSSHKAMGDIGHNGILFPLDRGERSVAISSITDGTKVPSTTGAAV